MTDPQPTPAEEPTTAVPEPPEPSTDPVEGEEPDTGSRAAKEAAKYRKRLAETTAERDALSAERDALRADVIAGLVSGKLADPEDFARYTDPAELLDDDGRLSRAKVTTAVDALLEAKPYLSGKRQIPASRRPQMPDGNPGVRGGGSTATPGSLADRFGGDGSTTMSDLLDRHGDVSGRARTRSGGR